MWDVWTIWRAWRQLKEGNMTAAQILQLVQFLIPIFTPLVIAGIKQLVTQLPKALVPILAPIIGALAAALSGATDPVSGAALGLAGIGVREVFDQTKQAMAPPPARNNNRR